MEKHLFYMNGDVKLPIGFRFCPTDEELLVHYLKRKVLGVPLPASVIHELDVFQTDPWNLPMPGDDKERKYFFYNQNNEIGQGKRKRIADGRGYWKPVGKGKRIVASGSDHVIGTRKALVFCHGKMSKETKIEWVMHEYRLMASPAISKSSQVSSTLENWVVYRVFQRKKRWIKRGERLSLINNASDMLRLESSGHPGPSSPCFSGITEVSANVLDDEEISSFTRKT
ncbi:hypothetical protein K2173_027141 [Erythroxylum novogranatense]|uniref:NAC domain-containing protein n=1 Tax=Erythroxylum novogranatense TaxID=1862640 RepID=A0AAV8U115_9ROSI|nr:hypothetical protein K2173_027141 [Erythroxylum novogranatense]